MVLIVVMAVVVVRMPIVIVAIVPDVIVRSLVVMKVFLMNLMGLMLFLIRHRRPLSKVVSLTDDDANGLSPPEISLINRPP
jgi:hypothetical protein